jgi:hypothetical protein
MATNNESGRLAYWQAKAELSQQLFAKQVEDKDKQGEAIKNLERFIHAKNMESALLAGVNYSWLQPTEGDN